MNTNNNELFTEPAFSDSPEPIAEDPKIYYTFSVRESFFAWFCLIFGYLFCRAFPPADHPFGLMAVILISFVVTAVILYKKDIRFDFNSTASAAFSIVSAVGLFVSADAFAQFIAFAGSALGYSYFVYTATGNKLEKGFSDLLPMDFIRTLFVVPFSAFGRLWLALFSGKKSGKKVFFKIIIGLAVAVIPTAIVIALLSYDNDFSNLLDTTFSFLDDFNLFAHIGSLMLGGLVAMYVFGLYSASVDRECDQKLTAESCRNAAEKARFAPTATIAAALLPLIVVYLIFFVSQWQYYVSGFSGIVPEGLNYAEYARNGFFELCAVSAINFFILAAVSMFTKRQNQLSVIFLKSVSIVISLMSLILIATAMSKMLLYINSYGLTEKRVVASWFMVLLALIFILVIVKQFVKNFRLIPSSGIIIALMVAALTLSNYNGIIADYNVSRYIDGSIEQADINALAELGSPAVPAIIRYAEYFEKTNKIDIVKYVDGSHEDYYKINTEKELFILVTTLREFKYDLITEPSPVTAITVPDIKAKNALNEYLKQQ